MNRTLIGSTPTSIDHGVLTEPLHSEIWVRSHEDPKKLAKEILYNIEEFEYVDLACIGAACINQAIKSVAVARCTVNNIGIIPFFSMVTDDQNRSRTRLVMRVLRV